MLSRISSHPHDVYSNYPDYHQQRDMLTQPQLNPLLQNGHAVKQQVFDNLNLQAGRKRTTSELEPHDSTDSNGVRRRISRACDQCNQLRTKCDGKHPCAHCTDNALPCEYARAHKKRGRAPKKDNEQSDDGGPAQTQNHNHGQNQNGGMPTSAPRPNNSRKYSNTSFAGPPDNTLPSNNTPTSATFDTAQQNTFYNGFDHASGMPMSTNGQIPNGQIPNGQMQGMDQAMIPQIAQTAFQVPDPRGFPTQMDIHNQPVTGFGFPLGDDYSVAFMGKAPMVESPDWLALTSPMYITDPPMNQPRPPDQLRYPVLRPLLPHIESIMPQAIACELLEQYFTSSTSAYLRPSNPYILGYVFRKKSILSQTEPRPCTPALLSSMLWIAAQTSDSGFLTSQLDARGRICQKLLELTISMLKPLIHSNGNSVNPTPSYHHLSAADASLAGLVVPTDRIGNQGVDRVQIDNLATYIHLATVVSASERKATSLRWWNAAWSLAREIRLGRELPPNPTPDKDGEEQKPSLTDGDIRRSSVDEQRSAIPFVGEEEREERRRTWWLLYMQDRHLALCYNRPMFFLNRECENLLQPLDDDLYQSGRFEHASDHGHRRRGLNIECTSHSIFGYFLPLMVLLGEILDLNHARNRPRFGPRSKLAKNWEDHVDEISQALEAFGQSLRDFEANGGRLHIPDHNQDAVTPSVVSTGTNDSVPHSSSEVALQTRTTVAYSTHIMHVLHILLTGKWDPIALLDDNDLWISSNGFLAATNHAVSAADAVGDIIDFDPDLSFMPFFFGIYLLQGSFLLLLFADKLQGAEVSAEVVRACETIVRAHEVYVYILQTLGAFTNGFIDVLQPSTRSTSATFARSCAPPYNRSRGGFLMILPNNNNGGEKFSHYIDGLAMVPVLHYKNGLHDATTERMLRKGKSANLIGIFVYDISTRRVLIGPVEPYSILLKHIFY
jgi:xylanolytic transcriptional activator XlnR